MTGELYQSYVTQPSLFESTNGPVDRLMQPLTAQDVQVAVQEAAVKGGDVRQDAPGELLPTRADAALQRWDRLKEMVRVETVRTPAQGFPIPWEWLPTQGSLPVRVQGDRLILDPQGGTTLEWTGSSRSHSGSLWAPPGMVWNSELANYARVQLKSQLKGVEIAGLAPLSPWQLDTVAWQPGNSSLWNLADADLGVPVLVAKEFRQHNVQLGDRGYVAYLGPTGTTVQEQRVPVYVAGFYDPGLTPYGSRQVLTSQKLTAPLLAVQQSQGIFEGDKLLVHLNEVSDAPRVCQALTNALEKAGLSNYWTVRSYAEDPAVRPFVEQFRSDRSLLLLVAILMMLVSASNILAMLLLLIHDKKREIAILQAMGARRRSVAGIFALCGLTVGVLGGAIGTLAAWLTLRNIDSLVNLLSWAQGRPAFQTAFYGASLPNTMDLEALGLVLGATALLSLLAALIPAVRASRLSPTELLREPA
jgi:ABC-type lipoprotein release transport system permease subunit